VVIQLEHYFYDRFFMFNFIKKLIKNSNEEEIKDSFKIVDEINSLESKYLSLSDEELKSTTEIL